MKEKLILLIPVVGVAVFVTCWVAAALMNPNWHLMCNWASDLGKSESPGRLLFNLGLTVSGLAFIAYGYAVLRMNDNVWYRLCFMMMIACGVMFSGAGIFSYDLFYIHTALSMAAFTLFLLTMIYFAVFLFGCRRYAHGGTFLVLIIAFAVFGLNVPLMVLNNVACMYVPAMTAIVSTIMAVYRPWTSEIPPFAPLKVNV